MYIKGACLRYDAKREILIAKPFAGGVNCWNSADWIVLLLPIYIFVYSTVIIILNLPVMFIVPIVMRLLDTSLPVQGDPRKKYSSKNLNPFKK